ncbi:MAG: agmatine deiminase family protein [Tannerellaceae bacterium]|nr:agmatine deiminase family protein [Tannerellaceae bacterium]
MRDNKIVFPAEWHPQSAVQLTWPNKNTDWASIMDEVIPCYAAIAKEIIKREKLLIVCDDERAVRSQLKDAVDYSRIIFCLAEINDTWARDHGGISVVEDGIRTVYNFTFNGWGMRYPANYDNQIVRLMFTGGIFPHRVELVDMQPFVLEGGSIDTDGKGTLLTTVRCLTSVNRNEHLQQDQLEYCIKEYFGLKRILWLHHGYLEGDDTGCHIDTLARFCSEDTIAYVQCADREDAHYEELQAMEEELKTFIREDGEPYNLLPLPMADKVEWEGSRLPATYANFLIINGAVLVPFYNSLKDEEAKAALQSVFIDREVTGINCLPLIKQRGSLHCATMQYPLGFIE